MQQLGKKSYFSMLFLTLLFVLSTVICIFYGEITFKYIEALFFTNDSEALSTYSELFRQHSFGHYGRYTHRTTPIHYTLVSFIVQIYSIYTLAKRLTQPRVLIECDDRGFYLHMPFNKSWYVLYEEIIGIRVAKYDFPIYAKKRNANWFFYDPDDYIELDTRRMMGEKSIGAITVAIRKKRFVLAGVKEALPVARKMQTICNKGRKEYFEWLDDQARQRREKELIERTKT